MGLPNHERTKHRHIVSMECISCMHRPWAKEQLLSPCNEVASPLELELVVWQMAASHELSVYL